MGITLDTLGSLAEIFVLLPVYGFIYNLFRIGLQSVDSEDNFLSPHGTGGECQHLDYVF